jgi:hypothetical protein
MVTGQEVKAEQQANHEPFAHVQLLCQCASFCPVAGTDLHGCISTGDSPLIHRSLCEGMCVGLRSFPLLLCYKTIVVKSARSGYCDLQAAAVTKGNKRQGPLPLFLAQFLVLAAYGGLGFLAFKKDEETRKAVAIVLGVFRKGYNKLQQVLPSGSKA